MAKFTFNLPNGQLFTLDGPADATVAQAELIFLEQLASGSFVGLVPGDILQSPATTAIQFELSRLDRGTAGVPNVPLIAIYNGGSIVVDSANTNTTTIDGITTTTTTGFTILSSLPLVTDVPITNGITTADYLGITTVTQPIGPLTPSQVQAVIAAIGAFVCQPFDVITNEAGLGKFGLNAVQLEQTGYLKPGTEARFITDPANFVEVLSSPAVWTGLDGVTSVGSLLTNPVLQDNIQLNLMQASYETLVQKGQISIPPGPASTSTNTSSSAALVGAFSAAAGAIAAVKSIPGLQTTATNLINSGIDNITGTINSTINNTINSLAVPITAGIASVNNTINLVNGGIASLGGLLANASKFGVNDAIAWATGRLPSLSGLIGHMQKMASLGQFAVNFNDFKLPAAVAGIAPAIGYTGTVNRATLNSATSKLIGSDKIPLPKFAPEAISSGALTALANQAKVLLLGNSSISSLLSSGAASIGGAVSSARSLLSSGQSALSVAASARSVLSSGQSVFSAVSSFF